jgi:hypothetical protein
VKRGIGEEALLVAFLVRVSTKLDFIDRATEGAVARRCRVRSAGKCVPIWLAEEVERSALSCSIVVVDFVEVITCWYLLGGVGYDQYQT